MPLEKPLAGSRHAHEFALGSHALDAGQVQEEAPGKADVEPPPHGVQGASPSALPNAPASHWQSPLEAEE